MKKLFAILGIVVLLSLLLSVFIPFTAQAQSTVAPIVISYDLSFKRLSFDAFNLQWSFYSYSSNMYFRTSADLGNTWSNATLVAASSSYSDTISVYTDGVYGYYIHTSAGGLMFNRGILHGNGTVDWYGESATGFTGAQYSMVTVDSAGYPVIAEYKSSYGVMIYIDANNDGSWSTGSTVNIDGGYGYATFPCIVPLDSRQLVYIGAKNLGQPLRAAFYNGSAWSSVVSGASSVHINDNTLPSFSCVRDGQYVDVSFLTTGNVIRWVQYNSLSNKFGAEGTISAAASTSEPVASSTDSGLFYTFWQDYPNANSIYYSVRSSFVGWSAPALLLGNETLLSQVGGVLQTAPYTREDSVGVYFVNSSSNLKFQGVYSTGSPKPIGTALGATDIAAGSATLSVYCVWDGGIGNCTATFFYGGGGQEGNITYGGTLTTGGTFSVSATGLVPNSLYVYWVVLHNANGDYYTNLMYFQTAVAPTTSAPIVETKGVESISSTTAIVNGHLIYDGGLTTWVGFEWRVQGTSTWSNGWNPGTYSSDQYYQAELSSLQINTTYEYRAIAHNAMVSDDNWITGNTYTFTTGYTTVPTTTPSGISIGGTHFPLKLSSGNKIAVALAVTILSMIAIGYILRKAKSACAIAVVADALGWLIAFTIWSWYPLWVILFVAIILGFITILVLLTRR